MIYLECAAARVDVAAVELALGLHGRVYAVKLHHGVEHVALPEDHDAHHLPHRRAHLVNRGLRFRKFFHWIRIWIRNIK